LKNRILTLALIFFVASNTAHADVVVRDSQTSEDEFQAQAMALGHTPIAEWMAKEDHRAISPALKEIFQARLVDAQSEWIRRVPGKFDSTAIDRLLDLEPEADWSTNEREAFVVFANRKAEAMPTDTTFTRKNRELRAEFPNDVTGILLNGREVSRSEFATLELPGRPTRLTLLSNSFAPVSVKLSGFESLWPRFERRAWVTENCGQITTSTPPADVTVSILASDRCRDALKIASASVGDRELIEKFGIDRLKSEPMREPEKSKPLIERPWVWAAAGVLAIGAAIAYERSQNQASVQPVARDGW
jgi:hypothetical protein